MFYLFKKRNEALFKGFLAALPCILYSKVHFSASVIRLINAQWNVSTPLRLCQLAIESSKEWDKLMQELNDSSLLDRTDCLWFGDATVVSSEGNIDKAAENLKALGVADYELLEGKEAIQSDERFSFISDAVNDIALYFGEGAS